MSSNQYDTSGKKGFNPFFKEQTPNPIYKDQDPKKPVTSNAILNSTSYKKVETKPLPQVRPSLASQFQKFKTPEQKKNGLNPNETLETPSIAVVVPLNQFPKESLPTIPLSNAHKKTPLTKPSTLNQGLKTAENNPNLNKLNLSSRVKKKDEKEFPKLPLSFVPIVKNLPEVPILKPDDVIIEDSGEHDTGLTHSPMELPTYQHMTFSDMPFSQFEDKEEKKKEEDFGDSSTDTDMPEVPIVNFEVPTLNVSYLDVEIPDLDISTENFDKSIQNLGDTVDVMTEDGQNFISRSKVLLGKVFNKSTDDITKDIANFVASDLKRKVPPEEVLPSKVAKLDEIPKLLTKDITVIPDIMEKPTVSEEIEVPVQPEIPVQPEVPVQPEIVVELEEEPYRLVKLGNGKWELIIDPNTQDELIMKIKK